MGNPNKSYSPFKDAKFLTGLFDLVTALVIFFVGKYSGAALEDVKFVILSVQPVFVMLVIGFFQRDQAERDAGVQLRFLK